MEFATHWHWQLPRQLPTVLGILLAELMNGYCWLYNNTVYNVTRTTSTVTKPH